MSYDGDRGSGSFAAGAAGGYYLAQHNNNGNNNNNNNYQPPPPNQGGLNRVYYGDENERRSVGAQDEGSARNPQAMYAELDGQAVWRVGGVGVLTSAEDRGLEGQRAEVFKDWSRAQSNGHDAWLNAARRRAAAYLEWKHRGSVLPLSRWHIIDSPNAPIPQDAIQVGREEDGAPLYAARAFYEGGIHTGKAGPHLGPVAHIPYGGREVMVNEFEILCGDPSSISWMQVPGGQSAIRPGFLPVEGGREFGDGRGILVARVQHHGGLQIGKAHIGGDSANIPFAGKEVVARDGFEVMTYAAFNRR